MLPSLEDGGASHGLSVADDRCGLVAQVALTKKDACRPVEGLTGVGSEDDGKETVCLPVAERIDGHVDAVAADVRAGRGDGSKPSGRLLPVVGSGFRKKGLPLLVGDRGQTRNKGFRCGFTSLDGLVRHSRKAFELFRQRLGDEEQVAFQLKNLSAVQIHQGHGADGRLRRGAEHDGGQKRGC